MNVYVPTKLRRAGSHTTGTYADPANNMRQVRAAGFDGWMSIVDRCVGNVDNVCDSTRPPAFFFLTRIYDAARQEIDVRRKEQQAQEAQQPGGEAEGEDEARPISMSTTATGDELINMDQVCTCRTLCGFGCSLSWSSGWRLTD